MESKEEGPFREFFEQMMDLLQTSNFKTSLIKTGTSKTKLQGLIKHCSVTWTLREIKVR